jgi:hypothetical protein
MTRYLLIVMVLSACGGSSSTETAAEPPPAEEAAPPAPITVACVTVMNRERECADTFIPELVDLRVRLDQPPGIREQDETEGRDALVAQARSEYEGAGVDIAIEVNCNALARLGEEQQTRWRTMLAECAAITDCNQFTECDIRITEARFGE